jgi:hypothetical protein
MRGMRTRTTQAASSSEPAAGMWRSAALADRSVMTRGPVRGRQPAPGRMSKIYGVVVATARRPRRTRIGRDSGEVSSRMNR